MYQASDARYSSMPYHRCASGSPEGPKRTFLLLEE